MNNPNINLYHGDSLQAIKQYPDNYWDLSIIDPPYGIGESGKTNKTRSVLAKAKDFGDKEWDSSPASNDYFLELKRVSKNQIIWGANHFLGWTSSCWLVWDKQNGNNDFADCELAYTSFSTAVRKFSFRWHGMLRDKNGDNDFRIHPTQKPIALYKWILKNYANQGDKVLDTHGGSMSIALACWDMGFDLDLWEIDEDYYNAGLNRFNQHISQTKLF